MWALGHHRLNKFKFNFKFAKILYLIVSLLIISLFSASCVGYGSSQSTFEVSGPVAQNQLNLFNIILALGVIVFIIVEAALIYVIIKFRRKKTDGIPKQTHGNQALEITWTVIPALILVIAAIPTVSGVFFAANPPLSADEGAIVVEATGHQWWFEFDYPQYGVHTANEIHIPVETPVIINLRSNDVIHSFWVPKLAGKVDMVPGNKNHLWFQADEAGEYLGQCAEFCGVAHANMRFRVVAESMEDFTAWTEHQLSEPKEPIEPLAAQGKNIFMGARGGCMACHQVKGTNAMGKIGPDLTHVATRTTLAAGMTNNTQQNLKSWIRNPEKVKPGNLMSANAPIYQEDSDELTEAEISALAAYLGTLK
ncbi:MAG: cytochrome c oxidase subunit II [Chloroflexi bacterium]|nr:cytochrome c oxidase subunit II [Chloroflexota bacterium]